MRLAPATLLLLLGLSAAAFGQSPSFDCGNAQTPRERTVCASPQLSDMDARMATAYATLESTLSQTAAAAVQQDQHEWLPWLDKVCPPADDHSHDGETCLMNRYSTRLAQLTASPLRTGGLVIYPRGHYVFVARQVQPKESLSVNPQFGYGAFSWPQIDHPTPAEAAWNDAVYQATIRGTGMGETRPKRLDDAVNGDGYVEDSYTVSSADSHFIDVQLGSVSYDWGAAHGNESITSFAWWLDKARALQADDIFASDSGWQEALSAQALAKLQRNPGPDALWKPGKYVTANQLQSGVADGVARPSAWTITADGLTITFGSYEVGPYSSGMPSVHFTWRELQPMLATSFEPNSVPVSQLVPK